MQKVYSVVVDWISPRGTYPSAEKLLSVNEQVWEGQPYFKFSNDSGWETFFFTRKEDAEAFKSRIKKFYSNKENPLYFVIDDGGNVVRDEEGNPIVAWTPEVEIVETET